jgi:hypothetical protein
LSRSSKTPAPPLSPSPLPTKRNLARLFTAPSFA